MARTRIRQTITHELASDPRAGLTGVDVDVIAAGSVFKTSEGSLETCRV